MMQPPCEAPPAAGACWLRHVTGAVFAVQPGETREAPQDLVYLNEAGVQRHVKGIADKLTVRQAPGPAPGKSMAILGGRHAHLLCEVGSCAALSLSEWDGAKVLYVEAAPL